MPGVSARSAAKNMSRAKRGSAAKNVRRVEAALCEVEEYAIHATYGKVTKALGNKMFTILSTKGTEHLAHIRGKMVRVAVDDIVLLNIRDYESRSSTSTAVYDIIALFSSKDVSKLIRSETIPKWMGRSIHASDDEDDAYDLFDFEADVGDDGDESDIIDKRNKKSHRAVKADDNDEVDIDKL
jgi:translation initiation factor IF-1